MYDYDVAVIGNDLSANIFARYYHLNMDRVNIALLGPRSKTDYGLGESITEVGSHFLQYKLQLSSHLMHEHAMKKGLQFFFPHPDNADLREASVTVPDTPSPITLFHINPEKLKKRLWELNDENGVDSIEQGVQDVDFTGEARKLTLEDGRTIRANWIVDASGRQRFLTNELNLHKDVENNVHGAAGGHFKTRNKIDEMDRTWLRQKHFTPGEFMTNHFTDRGYWVWMIPQEKDIVSCGVIYDRRYKFEDGLDEQGFVDFLQDRDFVSQVIEPTRDNMVDFYSLNSYSYTSERFVSSKKKYCLLGDSGAFVDPLYSPAINIVGEQCILYTDLMQDDQNQSDALQIKSNKIEFKIAALYEYYSTLILGNNLSLGSFEIFSLRYLFEFYYYYVSNVWPLGSLNEDDNNTEMILDQNWQLDSQLIELLTDNFNIIAEQYLDEGLYYRKNMNWRQTANPGATALGSARDFAEKLSLQDTHILSDRIHELFTYTFLRQAELYLKRRDIATSYFGDELFDNFSRIEQYADIKKQQGVESMFEELASNLDYQERPDRFINDIQKKRSGEYRGDDMDETRMHYSEDLAADSMQRRENKKVVNIITHYAQGMDDPDMLDGLMDVDPEMRPFCAEGIATGLVEQGMDLPAVYEHCINDDRSYLEEYFLIGIGIGLFEHSVTEEEIDFFSPEQQRFIFDGLGFEMGMEKLLEKNRRRQTVFFPGDGMIRNGIARGLGRSVIFMVPEVSVDVYEKAFDVFGLYPDDRYEYYFGAGVSLSMTGCDKDIAQHVEDAAVRGLSEGREMAESEMERHLNPS